MSATLLKLPGTAAQTTPGTIWVNPNNIKLDDGVFATCTLPPTSESRTLRATNYGFNISTDPGTVIRGFRLEIKGKTNIADKIWKIGIYNAGQIGHQYQDVANLTGTNTAYFFGGPNSLFGCRQGVDFTVSNLADATFGFYMTALSVHEVGNSTCSLDCFKMQIFYSIGDVIYDSNMIAAGIVT